MEAQRKTLELDGMPTDFDAGLTFGALSNEIRTRLAPQRVLTEIVIDGKALDLGEEDALHGQMLGELGNIVLRSRQVDELFRESLQLAPKICEALALDCEDIDKFIVAEDLASATDRVGELTSLLEWLLQLIAGMQSLGNEKIEDMTFSEGRVMDTVNRMQFLLAKLHLHFGAQQWKDFREVLNKDFKAEVHVWKALFADMTSKWTPRNEPRAS